jgi:hypothetical protein
MKARLIFWILGASLLMGCSSTPEKTPDCEIPAPMAEVGLPVIVPEMPLPVSSTEASTIFDHDGIVTLTQVRISAVTNEKVAKESALALDARNQEVNALIECARYQNVWIQVHAEDLKDEKREHFIDNWLHRGLIALGLIAVAL